MKRVLLISFLLLTSACASPQGGATQSSSQPGHGAITMMVVPNPIVAKSAGRDMYDFPFDVVVRETGGHPVHVTRVSADVYALGSILVAQQTYDAAQIASMGFATTIPANGELRYSFRPRKEVTDERLFGGVSAEVVAEGADETGTAASATTTVSVTR